MAFTRQQVLEWLRATIAEGRPIAQPEDAQHVLERVKNVHGFYSASSVERLPTETAIQAQMEKFKAVRLK